MLQDPEVSFCVLVIVLLLGRTTMAVATLIQESM